MKKIELKNLRAGQMVEAKHNVIDSHGDLIYKEWNLYTFSKLENLPYYSVKTEDGYSNIVDDDYLNEHFRLPALTEGKEYECVSEMASKTFTTLKRNSKYKYLGIRLPDEFVFTSEYSVPIYITASEVFTHFGIVVGEEKNCCTNCGSELHDTDMCPTISDPPKPEVNWKLVSEGEYISQLQSRIKELEGEVKYFQSIYLDMTNKAVELKIDNQSLKANGQEEK